MKKLFDLALSVKGKYRVAACCYDKHGKVIAYGTNSYTKTHPKQAHFARISGCESKTFLHAEIAAIVRSAGRRPFKLQVIRVSKTGELRMAKPCAICQLAIKEAGIKLVEYSL